MAQELTKSWRKLTKGRTLVTEGQEATDGNERKKRGKEGEVRRVKQKEKE